MSGHGRVPGIAPGREAGPGPSAWAARLPAIVLASVGFLIAAYLTAFQAGRLPTVWDPVFGTGSVRVLAFGAVLPVPDAAFGAIGYLAEVVLGLAGGADRWRRHPRLVVLYGVIVAAMAATALVLIALQLAVLRTGCTLCLASALISIAIAALVLPEVRTAIGALRSPAGGGRLDPHASFDRRSS